MCCNQAIPRHRRRQVILLQTQSKATHRQGNKEEDGRFGLKALGSTTVFAKSVSTRFPSLQTVEALVGQKEAFRDTNHLRRELTAWFALKNNEFYERG
ncbi:hypothetical protein KIN20_011858 [Parelaphostrongylus tenuis]|uniref:Uncharacterized protein n=1 Tax=Parelaphostrongylus tenuis TaxID=148309 RepID=A0AAD5N0M0_PARTN|nr:hypothetical protein KIN20_011858 [Parelaphostrongylus tenuis]